MEWNVVGLLFVVFLSASFSAREDSYYGGYASVEKASTDDELSEEFSTSDESTSTSQPDLYSSYEMIQTAQVATFSMQPSQAQPSFPRLVTSFYSIPFNSSSSQPTSTSPPTSASSEPTSTASQPTPSSSPASNPSSPSSPGSNPSSPSSNPSSPSSPGSNPSSPTPPASNPSSPSSQSDIPPPVENSSPHHFPPSVHTLPVQSSTSRAPTPVASSKKPPPPVSSATSATPTQVPVQSCSCSKSLGLSLGLSIPATAVITFIVTALLFMYCQKARKGSDYVRMAPTVYFDEEEQD